MLPRAPFQTHPFPGTRCNPGPHPDARGSRLLIAPGTAPPIGRLKRAHSLVAVLLRPFTTTVAPLLVQASSFVQPRAGERKLSAAPRLQLPTQEWIQASQASRAYPDARSDRHLGDQGCSWLPFSPLTPLPCGPPFRPASPPCLRGQPCFSELRHPTNHQPLPPPPSEGGIQGPPAHIPFLITHSPDAGKD